MSRPIVIIEIRKGWAERITGHFDADVDIIIHDYDVDGRDEDDLDVDIDGVKSLRYML